MLQFDLFADVIAFFAAIFFIVAGFWNIFTSREVVIKQYDIKVSRYALVVLIAKKNRIKRRTNFTTQQNFENTGNFIAHNSYNRHPLSSNVPSIVIAANKITTNTATCAADTYSLVNLPQFDVVNGPLKRVFARGYAHV